MSSTYKVRIWAIKPRKSTNGKVISYGVRWAADNKEFYESYKTRAQAEGRRAALISAQRCGEPFNASTGFPLSLTESAQDKSWYEFACEYVDMKWPNSAGTYRRTIAEALTSVTPVMLKDTRTRPDSLAIRSVLLRWGFNSVKREQTNKGGDDDAVLSWVQRNALPLSHVTRPEVARTVHDAAVTRLDGKARAFCRTETAHDSQPGT